jgi:hypothetical protein
MYLNMPIPAVIGIVSFSLSMLPTNYYQTPVGIIGKFYANSMLALINSRMLLGSEQIQTPSMDISVLRFGTASANLAESAIEAENGDVAVDNIAWVGPSGSSDPKAV